MHLFTRSTKLSSTALLLTFPALAQSAPTKTAATRIAARHVSSASACATVPTLSSKIPALPAGSSCPKPLYTLTLTPSVHLENVSPLEGPSLADTLGIQSSSFTLAYVDFKQGTGEPASAHKYYSIQYTGYLVDGTKFDSSLDRGEPFSVAIGQHQVIPGWDTGFAGMHVGGKRRLFIPYQLAYGPGAHGASIPAKSELIFDVELVAVSDNPPAPKAPASAPASSVPPATAPIRPATDPAKPTINPSNPSPTPPAGQPTDPTKPTITPSTPPPAK